MRSYAFVCKQRRRFRLQKPGLAQGFALGHKPWLAFGDLNFQSALAQLSAPDLTGFIAKVEITYIETDKNAGRRIAGYLTTG